MSADRIFSVHGPEEQPAPVVTDEDDDYAQDGFDGADELQDAPSIGLLMPPVDKAPVPVLTDLPLMLSAVPLLDRLDRADLDRVASALRPEHYEEGAEVIPRADTLYIVESGAAVAEIDGAVVMRYGRGDFFGELGTLAPRKAIVRAVGPTGVRCMSLARDDFDLPEFADAMIWEKIFTNSPASLYKQPPAAAPPAAVAPDGSPRKMASSPPNRPHVAAVTRATSATSDSFATQMAAAGLATPADASLSDSSSDADGEARLYQATKRAVLREHAELHSARVGTLLAGEVTTAQPADGGLRLHCHGRGWASAAADDGSPLLLPLSRELRSSMPVFGRYYSATVRVPIRDSPAVSSACIAAILPGECVRIDRVVLNELAVPKLAISHQAEYEADASAGAEAVSSTTTLGWASFWSISDASALFVMEDETPPPSRIWGVGGTGAGLQPPSCRPPPPQQLDGSGGPTGMDAEGRVVFGYREPRTVTRAALAMQALGKSATREQMKLKMAIDASADTLQLSSVDRAEIGTMELDATATGTVPSPGSEWRAQSFTANPNRHIELVNELERPCTVSFVRGHVSMDDLSYVRQTFAKPSNLLASFGSHNNDDDSETSTHTDGSVHSRIGGSGYSMSNCTLHSPSSWVHIDGNSSDRYDESWAHLDHSGLDTPMDAASTEESEYAAEHKRARARARLAAIPPPPPPPTSQMSGHPLPGRPAASSKGNWSLYETSLDPDVEGFLEPLNQILPGLRKACLIARMDDQKLAELEGLRRHWCLEEGDSDVQDAASHPFLRWMQRLGVGGIDHTLAACAALRNVYQERWDWQAAQNEAAVQRDR